MVTMVTTTNCKTSQQDLIRLETKMIDKLPAKVPTKGFLNYEMQLRGSEWYQVSLRFNLVA